MGEERRRSRWVDALGELTRRTDCLQEIMPCLLAWVDAVFRTEGASCEAVSCNLRCKIPLDMVVPTIFIFNDAFSRPVTLPSAG